MANLCRWWTVLFVIGAVGCGQADGIGRRAVFGEVKGLPGNRGSISFLPAEGRKGPGAVGAIVEGRYQFNTTNGPTSGPHQLIIIPRADKKILNAEAGATPKSETGEVAEWYLTVEVPQQAPYKIDVQLDDNGGGTAIAGQP